jgi:hypothetical protein
MKLIASAILKTNYLIPLLLFLSASFIYEYNLEGHPWHGDEITYLGWGGDYFHLIAKGDITDSCILSLDNCNSLFHIPAFGLTYSPLRNVLIGFPMYLTNQDNGNFYNWSCYWDCYNHHESPSIAEITAGRLLSPIFGALGVVLLFLIGKMFFNRVVGIIASLFFLFYDLWMWYSRSIMVEVHYVFFVLLSLFLLLHALKNERLNYQYFVLSAIVFGMAINSKMLAMSFSGLFLCTILFKSLTCKKTNDSQRKHASKICILIFSFFAISLLGLFLVEPGFYQDPLNEIKIMKSDMDNYNHDVWYIGYPSLHGIQLQSIISVLHYAIFPSFIEKQISDPNLNLNGNFGWTYPPTYSSIPMTVFFFIGLAYIINSTIKSKIIISSDSLLIVWFVTTLILTLLIVKDFSLERYLLPLELSALFIASYGLWNFIMEISNNNLKIVFGICTLFTHSMTAMSYWEKIYFSPGTMWVNPLHFGTLQESLDNSLTFITNMAFVCFFLLMLMLKFRTKSIKIS